jgi:hypothetical protein
VGRIEHVAQQRIDIDVADGAVAIGDCLALLDEEDGIDAALGLVKEALPEAEYLAALERDLDFELATLDTSRHVEAVFFGGGTPSLFSPAGIGRILDHAAGRLKFAADAEITLEANPGTVEHGRFADYRHQRESAADWVLS